MKIKIFLALMIMLSMSIVCVAAPDTENYQGNISYYDDSSDDDLDDYYYRGIEAEWDIIETEHGCITKYEGEVDASIEVGHVVIEGTKTTTDFAGVEIHVEGEILDHDYCGTRGYIEFDGKVYQGTQVDDGRYHTYTEDGVEFGGTFSKKSYCKDWKLNNEYWDPYNISNSWYDKKDEPVNCMSSPAMGVGLRLPDGNVTKKGDKLPTLYTWAEKDDKWEHHTTFYFPTEGTYIGCVIVTPPQIAGEPIQETGYWDSAKGQRTLEWKDNCK